MAVDMLRKSVKDLIEIPFKAHHSIPIYAETIDKFNTIILLQIDTLLNKPDVTDSELADDLSRFLAQHWEKFKNTALCYTAQPNSPITKLFCDIATFVAENKTLSSVSILMPTASLQSLRLDSYPDLDNVENIIEVLNTHILGREGKYLIPVKCITAYDEAKSNTGLFIYNLYYDFQAHEDTMSILSEEEIHRLAEHSTLTKELYNAKKEFEEVSTDQGNLLFQLKCLLRHMYFNSSKGVGRESVSGLMVSQHIYNFMSFYDTLDVAQVKSIPNKVKEQIKLLRGYVSDRTINTTYGSCLATRREELAEAMQNQENILGNIQLSETTKESAIQKANQRLLDAKAKLIETLSKPGSYTEGVDKLRIPLRLIAEIAKEIEFNTMKFLDLLPGFSDEEIETCVKASEPSESSNSRVASIASIVGSITNLVSLATKLTPDQLRSFLKNLEPSLSDEFLQNGKDYLKAVITLDEARQAIFWQQYKAQLPAKVDAETMFGIFLILTEEQQREFYDGVKLEIQKGAILTSFEELLYSIQNLKPDFRLGIIQAYKDSLGKRTPDYFLSSEEMAVVYSRIEKQISEMASEGDVFFKKSNAIYIVMYIKACMLPALIRPYKNSNAFFQAVALPVLSSTATLCALLVILYFVIKSLFDLFSMHFSESFKDAKYALIWLYIVFILMVMTAASLPAIIIRAINTGAAPVLRVGSSNEISVEVRDDAGESVSISIPEREIIRV